MGGTGGYASYPAVHEAAKRRIPTAIHESNAYPGLTTRALSNKVDLVMVGFPEAAEYYKDAKRVEVTGTPVRGEFFTLDRDQARQELGLTDSQPLVISFWGSQGAGHMSERTVDLVERWAAEDRRFHYIHAAGRDYEDMTAELAKRKVSVSSQEVRPYIDDMPRVMAAADLVLADRGGVELIEEKDCTGESLYCLALDLLADGSRRAAMGKALKELASPRAAQDIYENLMSLVKK